MVRLHRAVALASSVTLAVVLGGCHLLGGQPPTPVVRDAPGDDTLAGAVVVTSLPSKLQGTLSPSDSTDTFAVSPTSGTFVFECSSTGETTFAILDSGGNSISSGYCYPFAGGAEIPLTVATPAYVQFTGANDSSYTANVSVS